MEQQVLPNKSPPIDEAETRLPSHAKPWHDLAVLGSAPRFAASASPSEPFWSTGSPCEAAIGLLWAPPWPLSLAVSALCAPLSQLPFSRLTKVATPGTSPPNRPRHLSL